FLDRETLSPQTRLRRPDFDHTWQAHDRTSAEQVAERIAHADIVIVNKAKLPAAILTQAPRLKLIAVAATGTDNIDLAACAARGIVRTSAEQVAERIAHADIVIVNKAKLPAAILTQAPRLKLIAVAATGTDNIDLAACAARGIVVSNIRGYATRTVPEHTFALIFALRRSVCAYRDAVRAGRWQAAGQFCFFGHPIRDLAGSTLGIIGDGELGQSVAAIGRALGMRVLFSGHKGRTGQGRLYTPFEQLLGEADILTLHCPLNDRTRHMISKPEFALMTRRPLLINTGRGGLVDEAAVGPALNAGDISGAAFDVTSVEPPPADHPFMALLNR
ncbi:D-2-hydroxyacid dehydrogenase, partial [Stenotrophomonas sp. YIM B06876]|uniref:D-2-hydroxyacid dehydrogenase n=1 Tax=Stenotrophomonas sp. YIM B06876 TaxID=3060211 RepID=UPI0027387743